MVGGSWEGRQRACFRLIYLFFFSKNSRRSCACPTKPHTHLLAVYPRSAGGLEGRLRPAVRGGMTLWKRAHDGSEFNSSFSFFFLFFFKHRSKFAHHLLHTLPERAGDALDSYAFCIFFVFCGGAPLFSRASSSQWHRHDFSLGHHFLFSFQTHS